MSDSLLTQKLEESRASFNPPNGWTSLEAAVEILAGKISAITEAALPVDVTSGRSGGVVLGGPTTAVGTWNVIQVLSDTVLGTVVGNITDLSEIPLPAGTFVYGEFTSVEVTSGIVILYGTLAP